jgi:hypothetical protein
MTTGMRKYKNVKNRACEKSRIVLPDVEDPSGLGENAMKMPKKILWLVLLLFMIAGCQTISQSLIGDNTALYYMPGGAEGFARYYANSFNGKRTTSGEIYQSKKLTAAHPTLPLGTLVKVVNLDNNKSVVVKINDRCLEHEDVFIDLSREAARRLGFLRQGKARVRITVI